MARLGALKSQLAGLDMPGLQHRLGARMATTSADDKLAPLISMLAAAGSLSSMVQREEGLGDWALPLGLDAVRDAIAVTVAQAKEQLRLALAEVKERETALGTTTAALRALEDRYKLAQSLPLVVSYVEESRWRTKATALAQIFPKILRSLTSVAKQASNVALHEDFEVRFLEECRRLRAPTVKLDFPGRRGEAARRKVVAGKHRVSAVLSEGEQKVIALADFLAEASLQESSAPVVFDDPVNSLDYRRVHEVVARLADISRKQQLVVFTHNIWFASLLLDHAKKNCLFYQVRDNGPQKGFVSVETSPRTDSLSELKKVINIKIQQAISIDGTARQALVESAYASLRAWCEVAVERQLLQEVVTRYQPMVRLTTLDKIKPHALKAATEAIVPVYERACRAIEAHSQPLETLSIRPSLVELRADWDAVQVALQAYQAA